MDIRAALDCLRYRLNSDGSLFSLYRAGMYGAGGHQWGPVMRDLFLSAIMMHDLELLEETFRFACHTQGTRYNPITGEEPGRILHEWEDVFIGGLGTRYNSFDSTLLFLMTSLLPQEVIEENRDYINKAADWLIGHITHDGLVIENPSFCGAKEYACGATYWKDSESPVPRKLNYPVSFLLTQAQALRALKVIGAEETLIDKTKNAFWQRFMVEPKPIIAIDAKGRISGFTSDILHSLYYLEPGDIPREKIGLFGIASELLKTPAGYRTLAPTEKGYQSGAYIKGAIWPFEQYFIAEGARRHGLEDIASTADSCRFNGFPELLDWKDGEIIGLGHKLQLWTVAYQIYRDRVGNSLVEL